MKDKLYILISIALLFSGCRINFYNLLTEETNQTQFNLTKKELLDQTKNQKLKIKIKKKWDNNTKSAILLIEEGWSLSNEEKKKYQDLLLQSKIKVIIKQDIYAPTLKLHQNDPYGKFSSKGKKATAKQIETLPHQKSEIAKTIKKIDAIKPPFKATSWYGIYPNDLEYPLIKKTWLVLMNEDKLTKNKIKKIKTIFKSYQIKKTPIVWVGGNGDMMLERGVSNRLKQKNGIQKIFGKTLPLIQKADLMIGNLEGAVTTTTKKTPKSFNFKFHPTILPYLKKAGYDYLSVNNNHCYDYGEVGYIDTLKNLKQASILTSGGGLTPDEAKQPSTLQLKEQTVKVLSLSCFPQERNGFNGEKQAAISKNRAGILWANEFGLTAVKEAFGDSSSINIIVIHGGTEWQNFPSKKQRTLYTKLAKLNTDLILSSHPHVLQGLEFTQNKKATSLIAWSLGNFIFSGMKGWDTAEETILLFTGFFNGKPLYVETVGVQINNQYIDVETSEKIQTRFANLTKQLY